ncbi:MAG: hypothetical protein U1F68_18355 [Gammaproteobacteria bacterium]
MKRTLFFSTLAMCYASAGLGQTSVSAITGRYCRAAAPAGWIVVAENPAGVAFGADLARADGKAGAGYMVLGVPYDMRVSPYYQQWYATPEQAIMANLTQFGSIPVSCNPPQELAAGSGYKVASCQSPTLKSTVIYTVSEAGDGGYTVVMRIASTPQNAWDEYGKEAIAVARSLQCQVPLLPSRADGEAPLSSAPDEEEADSE